MIFLCSSIKSNLLTYYDIQITEHIAALGRASFWAAPSNVKRTTLLSMDMVKPFINVMTWIRCGIMIVNIIAVLTVNMFYVYLTTLKLSKVTIGFVALVLSLFKLTWSNLIVLGVFSKYLDRSYERYEKNLTHTVSKINFLAYLTLFNNIVAPCLADALIDPNCFYYLIQSPPDQTISFQSTTCTQYTYDANMNMYCLSAVLGTHSTRYTPPFVYSYQCTSALLNVFATVFVYKYILSWALRVLRTAIFPDGMEINQSVWLQQLVPSSEQKQLTSSDIEKVSDNLNSSISSTNTPQTSIRDKVFNREAFIVTLIGDFAVLLTFGITFPPLALVVCCGILLNTWMHQVRIIRYFIQLQPNSFTDDNQRGISIDVQSVRTESMLSQASIMLADIDRLHEECRDLTVLLWPAIPLFSMLSAVFVGLFLYDMLGDQEGAVNAIWILILLAFVPTIIWMVEYVWMQLYSFLNKEDEEDKGMKMMDVPPNQMEETIEENVCKENHLHASTISPLAHCL